jgi:hypothetical protein
MLEEMEDYYDKNPTSQKGSDNKYTIEFDFASRIGSFLSYGDYFLGYSKEYECKIVADLDIEGCEDDEDAIHLEYDNGEIIHGVSEYGLGDV